MTKIIFSLFENEHLSESIRKGINAESGSYIKRQFPDNETYIRILSDVEKKDVILVCSLHKPDNKFLTLLYFCKLLKDLKAKSICLVSPYLSYMRQDKQFKNGEAITSKYFAEILSSLVDKLMTIDPHLHRIKSLNDIFTIPCVTISTSKLISNWILNNITNALIIGPDSESEQWVSEVANGASAPFIILSKIRRNDNLVEIVAPKLTTYKNYTPVLVDDIISTAHTMLETIMHLKIAKMQPPICIAVHAVFAKNSYRNLKKSEIKNIITTNTIIHKSNQIDISEMIIHELLLKSSAAK
jgi:ribose-phosphate pyrophosphokinase